MISQRTPQMKQKKATVLNKIFQKSEEKQFVGYKAVGEVSFTKLIMSFCVNYDKCIIKKWKI